jgi:hypothetical protein
MPLDIKEYVPQQVLYLYFTGVYTEAEFLAADSTLVDYLHHSQATLVHFIMDQRHLIAQPGIQFQSRAKIGNHARLGWVVIFGANNSFIRFVSKVVTGIFKVRIWYVDTFEEAVAFLQYVDSSLPDLHAPEYCQNISAYMALPTADAE